MKFCISQKDLSSALAHLTRIVPNRPSHPILGNILIRVGAGKATLTAFDLSVGLELNLTADDHDHGSLTVPGKLFFDIVSKLPDGELLLESAEDDGLYRLNIASDTGNYQIAGLPEEDFTALPTTDGAACELPAEVIRQALGHCLVSVSDDQTKQVLTGAHFKLSEKDLEIASTDGHRLGVFHAPEIETEAPDFAVTIPKTALAELERLLNDSGAETLTLAADDTQAVFTVDDSVLTCRILDGAYPAYNQLIPRQFSRDYNVDRRRLLGAVERVTILSDNKTSLVKLSFDGDSLTVSAQASDIGSAKEKMEFSPGDVGGIFEIAFNAKYLIQGLKIFNSTTVFLKMNEANQPCVIAAPGSDKTLYLLMPVQIVR